MALLNDAVGRCKAIAEKFSRGEAEHHTVHGTFADFAAQAASQIDKLAARVEELEAAQGAAKKPGKTEK